MNWNIASAIEGSIPVISVVLTIAVLALIALMFVKGTYELGLLFVVVALFVLVAVVMNERETLGI